MLKKGKNMRNLIYSFIATNPDKQRVAPTFVLKVVDKCRLVVSKVGSYLLLNSLTLW